MAKMRKPVKPLPKRNVVARDAEPRPGAGPMKDKRQVSRQQRKVKDRDLDPDRD